MEQNALGSSRAGFSTKIHSIVDAKGRPLPIELTFGQQHEMTKADDLLEHATGDRYITDIGYDSDRFREAIKASSSTVPPAASAARNSCRLHRRARLEVRTRQASTRLRPASLDTRCSEASFGTLSIA